MKVRNAPNAGSPFIFVAALLVENEDQVWRR